MKIFIMRVYNGMLVKKVRDGKFGEKSTRNEVKAIKKVSLNFK